MIVDLSALTDLGREGMVAFFLVFLRVGAAMAVLPAFGEQAVPPRIRLGLAIAFTLIVAPAVSSDLPDAVQPIQAVRLLGAEVFSGLVMGIGLRLFVLALQTAGAMAAQATSLAQIFGGSAGVDPQPAVGHLLTIAGLALAVMSGLHVRVAEALIASYVTLPPGSFAPAALIASWGTFRVAEAFSLGFTLAAPFVVASLIYNAALGAINRAMPQLMVAFVGAPALTFGGLALLFLVLPALLEVWLTALHLFLDDPMGPR
jgi:flagellar biosynthetic protein FliR